ncbi:MAG: DUF4007 family protein [Saprospiraceae bacterium]|nr:DUF4007 family protein [Saprospiraceae bacterium]
MSLLNVIESEINSGKKGREERYQIIDDERFELPNELFLYSILDTFTDSTSVSLKQIENEDNGPGLIFAINHKGISDKLKDIDQKIKMLCIVNSQGIKEIQWKKIRSVQYCK